MGRGGCTALSEVQIKHREAAAVPSTAHHPSHNPCATDTALTPAQPETSPGISAFQPFHRAERKTF